MLDIKFIRENSELVKAAAKKKRIDFDAEALLTLDDKRREMQKRVEDKRSEQNAESDRVASVQSEEERRSIISRMQLLKAEKEEYESRLREVMADWQRMMLQVPNIPDMSVPDGVGEEDNVEVKTWGEKTAFNFEPKDHIEIMTGLDMVDFVRGTKTHGFRGYFLKNDGVLLSWAVWNYAMDFFSKRNFTLFMSPTILHKSFFYGTGHLPAEAEDLFKTQDQQFLTGTAEVAMMAYHSDEVLPKSELPKRYLAFSPCFRREAGSHGKDIKGLIRVHEFFKWEQLVLCEADHQKSDSFFEELNRNSEEFIESLGLPYRRLLICGGDLSASKVKQYDVELWVPKEQRYREISSASYYHDFQTRRFNTKYKEEDGKTKYAHSLNCTAIPTPRILVSLVENFQNEDGSVSVPEVLRKYMGKEKLSPKK